MTSVQLRIPRKRVQLFELRSSANPRRRFCRLTRDTACGDEGVHVFTIRISCRVRPQAGPAGVGESDVVVATLDSFQATKLQPFFASLQRAFPHRPVLVTTTHPDAFDVFPLLEMGAADFLLPPLRASDVLPRLKRQARVSAGASALWKDSSKISGSNRSSARAPQFLEKVRCVPRFARCDATVLISGESGTGKELFARAIHYLSPRADRPFVPVNCGALPENLVESEIFGHKRGAFTGAACDRAGLIREAEGGTLFLDEIDCLTPQAQVKLLRFLQDGEYRSVGSEQIRHANIRVIAAANADFTQILRSGKFREDLFYRLSVLTLTLPPLRERPGDILLLTRDFLEKQAAITNTRPKNISLAALNRLLVHPWPGNVRELQNVLMRAIVLSDRCEIELSDLNLPDNGHAVGRPVVPNNEIACRLAIRARLSHVGSACASWEHHSRCARGEKKPPGVLATIAQTRIASTR